MKRDSRTSETTCTSRLAGDLVVMNQIWTKLRLMIENETDLGVRSIVKSHHLDRRKR